MFLYPIPYFIFLKRSSMHFKLYSLKNNSNQNLIFTWKRNSWFDKLNIDPVHGTFCLQIGLLMVFLGMIYTIQENFEMFGNGLNFILSEEEVSIDHWRFSNDPENDSSDPKNFNDILDADLVSIQFWNPKVQTQNHWGFELKFIEFEFHNCYFLVTSYHNSHQ